MKVYHHSEILEHLAKRGRELTDKVSLALVNRDYTPEDIMVMLVDTLALLRDSLNETERFFEAQRPRYHGHF